MTLRKLKKKSKQVAKPPVTDKQPKQDAIDIRREMMWELSHSL